MKKQFIKSICLALLVCGMAQTATAQGIVVRKTDGSKVYYKASDVESVGVYGYGEGPHDGPQLYVTIGGKKWATKNLGATTIAGSYETCFGDYYAWGETTPRYMTITRTGVNSATFTWKNTYGSGYSSSNYPTYTGTKLDSAHDAATAQMGEGWRTPTKADFEALAMACSGSSANNQTPISLINKITSGGIYWLTATQTYEPEYTGVAGLLFVDKNDIDNRVFVPAAGGVYDTSLSNGGTNGYYWSSSLYTSDANNAYYLYFYSSTVSPSYNYCGRYYGFTVRPVSD